MTEYHVRWRIEADGDSPRDVAASIRARYFQLKHMADVFEVMESDDPLKAKWTVIDLTRDEETVQWEFSSRALHRVAQKIKDEGGDIDEVIDMLEKPHKYLPELSAAVLEDEFNKISSGTDEPDLSPTGEA